MIKKEKDERASSKESVAAANKVATAQKGVATAEATLAKDHQAVSKAAEGLAAAQAKVAKGSPALVLAEDKLKVAHEKLAKAQETANRDATTTQKVLEAVSKYTKGAAVAAVKTLSGQWEVFKAKLNETEVTLGTKLMPTLKAMIPLLMKISAVIPGLVGGIVWLVSKSVEGWTKIIYWVKKAFTPFVELEKGVIKSFGAIIGWTVKLISAFVGMGVKLWNAAVGIIEKMVTFGVDLVKAIVKGILSSPKALIDAIGKLIPGSGIVGSALHAIGLAEGGIVTKPTLAVVGEAGPEAVIPLKGVGYEASSVKPLAPTGAGTTASAAASLKRSGLNVENLVINGAGMTSPQLVNEMYLQLRPLLQGA